MSLNMDLRFVLHKICRDNNTNDTAVILDIGLLCIKSQPKQELVVTL